MGEKDAERFAKFMTSRRNFTKIVIVAVGTIGAAAVIRELFGEKGKEEEKELEKLPPKKEKEIRDLSTTELIEELAEYPKAIKRAERQTPKEFAEMLAKKEFEFDSLIVGDVEPRPSAEKAVEILEEIIKNKKISVIALEGLSGKDVQHGLSPGKRFY